MDKQHNDFLKQSLINQIAGLSLQIAEREAIITEQAQEIQKLTEELKKYQKKKIKEMDNAE